MQPHSGQHSHPSHKLRVTVLSTLVVHFGLMEFQVSYFGYIEKLKEEMLNSRGDIERTVER